MLLCFYTQNFPSHHLRAKTTCQKLLQFTMFVNPFLSPKMSSSTSRVHSLKLNAPNPTYNLQQFRAQIPHSRAVLHAGLNFPSVEFPATFINAQIFSGMFLHFGSPHSLTPTQNLPPFFFFVFTTD